MNNLKLVMIILTFILGSCTQTLQTNGLSEKKIENFDVKIGKTSKKYLLDNYGPPIFENVFNDNVIYYISHSISYNTFDKRKNKNLSVFEITLDDKNIVQNVQKYSNKEDFDVNVSKKQEDKNINLTSFWKDIIRAFTRKNSVD